MSPLSHLTSYTSTKSNLYFANSLAVAVPNLMSLFHCLGHTRVSVQVQGLLYGFLVIRYVFMAISWQHLAQPPSWRTTPCRLSATAYSIYSQLPSILEAIPPSATWQCAMCLGDKDPTQLYTIIHSATHFDPIGSSSGCLLKHRQGSMHVTSWK